MKKRNETSKDEVKKELESFDLHISLLFLLYRDGVYTRDLIANFMNDFNGQKNLFFMMFVSGPYSQRSQRMRMLWVDVSEPYFVLAFTSEVMEYLRCDQPYKIRLELLRNMTYFLFEHSITLQKMMECSPYRDVNCERRVFDVFDIPNWMHDFLPGHTCCTYNSLLGWGACVKYVLYLFLDFLRREFNAKQSLYTLLLLRNDFTLA